MSNSCLICNSSYLKYPNYHGKRYIYCESCGLLQREPPIEDSSANYTTINPTAAINRSKEQLYNRTLDRVERHLGRAGQVLDVGCGIGHFLLCAQKKGWQGIGVEPLNDQVRQAQAKNLEVYKGELKHLPETFKNFDLITYWDVFMFVEHPLKELLEIKKRLAQHGILYLRIRNHTIVRYIDKLWNFGGKFCGFRNPAVFHPFNYEARTIQEMCRITSLRCKVCNGALTAGDAYQVSHSVKKADFIKQIIWKFVIFAERLTRGKIILSPTLDVWIRKTQSCR